MYGRGFGWLRALALLLLVVVVGGIGYTIGVTNAGVATDGARTVVYAPWGFGFGFFGLLFPILIIGLLFAAIGGGRRGRGGWHKYGGYGYGPGGRGPDGAPQWPDAAGRTDVPPMFEPMLQSWHRRAHGEPTTTTGPDTTPRPGG